MGSRTYAHKEGRGREDRAQGKGMGPELGIIERARSTAGQNDPEVIDNECDELEEPSG